MTHFILVALNSAKRVGLAGLPRWPWDRATAALWALILAGMMNAQTSRAQLAEGRSHFDVASIKASAPGAISPTNPRFMGSPAPGRSEAQRMTLRLLIADAYGVKVAQIYGGPGGIDSDGYDIVAKAAVSPGEVRPSTAPREPNMADMHLRLQTLLEDRFSLRVHRENRELPVYEMTVAKGGPKLQPSNCIAIDADHPPVLPAPGQPLPAYCGSAPILRNGPGWKLTGAGITMKNLIPQLAYVSGLTLLDKTGYTEAFNATLEWVPDLAPSPPSPDDASNPASLAETTGPSIFTPLQEQLGLKLESTKGPVEVLVVDRLERPSEN
jgi:uncharacterized protein (TIGR03435 family)